jgi:two-component system, OmpR family, sensor kinase
MRTPSLRRRVTVSGLVVFIALVGLLDVFVYVTLQVQLEDTLAEVLDARVELVREVTETSEGQEPEELVERLGRRGVRAILTTADGRELGTEVVSRFDTHPPATGDLADRFVTRTLPLDGGGQLEVLASRGGVDATLRRVLLVSLVGTLVAVIAAVVLFRRAASVAMAPLGEVAAAARRTADGQSGERLEPDDPTTELGRFAAVYDEMLDALEDALEQARSSEERTRRFLDDAAHQIRGPLTTIRASVETLLRIDDLEIRDQLLAGTVREVGRADRLLTSLLRLARLEAGGAAARRPTDLATLCADEVERCRSVAPDLDIDLDLSQAPGTELVLDAEGICEVLGNLLDNARRHADRRLVVAVVGDGDEVAVRVRDDGAGVDPAQRELIFERFSSLDRRGGSGLGLAIGRAIAESNGGTLRLEDGDFVLRLPAEPADREVRSHP